MRAIGGKGTKFGTNFQVFLQLFMVFKQNNLYLAPLFSHAKLGSWDFGFLGILYF
jgi:hypothetical protein